MKLISEKVSYKQEPGYLQVLILGKIERWKESLLTAWLLAWIFIGGVVVNEYYYAPDREMRMILIIFLIFWVYYFWRVGRVWLFRRGGNELIRLEGDRLTLKRSYFTFGKSKIYYIDIIKDFEPIVLSKTSFAYSYENGWWVLGGEKLGFKYHGRLIKFGMQLTDTDAREVYQLLKRRLNQTKKIQS